MIHLHRSVAINQHDSPCLVVKRRGERNAELHRSDGEAAFVVNTARVERRDFGAPIVEAARRLQSVPDMRNPRSIAHWGAVMSFVPFAIEIALANDVRRKVQRMRGPRQNLLDDEHALRTAKSAKCSLRRL